MSKPASPLRIVIGTLIAAVTTTAATAHAQILFDGTIHFGEGEEWGSAEGVAVQDNYTGFGNQVWSDPAATGSEIDELYVHTDGVYLYVGVSGNLQEDGNSIVLLLDTDLTAGTGQNILKTEITPVASESCSTIGAPWSVPNLGQALTTNDNGTPDDDTDDLTERDPESTRTVLDAGFEPDHAIAVDNFGGTVHVTQYSLSATSLGVWDDPGTNNGETPCFDRIEQLPYFATRVFRGEVGSDTGDGTLAGGDNPNGSQYAFSNEGTAGVTDTQVSAPGSGLTGDPRTQARGLEAKIHLADLGYTVPLGGDLHLRISALLVGGGGLVSNQILPGSGGDVSQMNLGFRPDFTTVGGEQFATIARTPAPFTGTIDGDNIVSDFGPSAHVASQDTVTSFGDRTETCTYLTDGSELDELFLRTDGEYLYVGLTGNLQTNGNAQIIFLDIDPAEGQNQLATEIALNDIPANCPTNGEPSTIQGLGQALIANAQNETIRDPSSAGTLLDSGFAPEHAIMIDTFSDWLHVNQYTLYNTSQGQWDDPDTPEGAETPCTEPPVEQLDYYATHVHRGAVPVNSADAELIGGDNPNGSLYAYNNTGVDGVGGAGSGIPPTPGSGLSGDPRSQTRGLEAKISLLDLGFAAEELPLTGDLTVKVGVMLIGNESTVSNQTLPGINAGDDITLLGSRPDLTAVAGEQFTTATLTPGAFTLTLDGRDIVSEFGTASVVASQDTVTGFGNRVRDECEPVLSAGSELDQMRVMEDGTSLHVAFTGNLQPNGNQIILFIDSIEGQGETLLDANTGRIDQMGGDTLPLDADFAFVVNIWETTAYVDLVNLITDESTYIGSHAINTGQSGIENNGPVADWELSVDNRNVLGVNDRPEDDPFYNPLDIQISNALTATRGYEISIPLSVIGSPGDGDAVDLFAMVTSGFGGYLSNQFLPAGLEGGLSNFADGETDLAAAGYMPMTIYIGQGPGECNNPRYDADGDGDVDQDDFGAFQACLTGAEGGVGAGCGCFDWNPVTGEGDGDIDGEDWGFFEACASGPDVIADPACDG